MDILKIEIEKIKNIETASFEIPIENGVYSLVGTNGCGKSSIFDALIYHNKAYGGSFGNTHNHHCYGQDYHFMKGSESNNFESIEMEFEDGLSFGEVQAEKGAIAQNNTIFSFRSSYRYNSMVDIKAITSVEPIEINNVGASTASDIDQRMEDNYRRLTAKFRNYMELEDCKPSEAKDHIIGELNKSLVECLSFEITSLGNVEDGKGSLVGIKRLDENIALDLL